MNRFRLLLLAAILVCVFGAQMAMAQPQPWTISTYQGNGQLICIGCNIQVTPGINSVILQQFDPIYAKVTDANGNPVPNTSVVWNVTQGAQFLLFPASTVTTTDSNGLTHILFTAPFAPGATGWPAQSIITAYPSSNPGAVATFTLNQTSFDPASNTPQLNLDFHGAPTTGTTLSGQAGSSGDSFTVGVFGAPNTLLGGISGPIQGVTIKLINYQSNATATCAQGSGADPGSVLTDATGYATCTPVFAGSGRGQFGILVGGIVLTSQTTSDGVAVPAAPPYVGVPAATSPSDPQPTYAGYTVSAGINIDVTPAAVAGIQFVSGNNQTANSGQALSAPLVGVVTSTGGNPIAGQAVTWTVTPAGAATLSNTSTVSDANGRVSTNVALGSTASGVVNVSVSGAGKTLTFTVNAVSPVTITGISKISGDTQTATTGSSFSNPLVVQVNGSNGQPAANQRVSFSVNGPATLSASSASTNSNGQAQVNVTAGSTTGNATVTATIGTFSTTFTLTVVPPGPVLTASSFYNGADFQRGSISPCSIATIIAQGVAPNVQGAISGNALGVGPYAYTVANTSVTVAGAQAPIYNVANSNGQQQVTFQVPCSVTAGSNVPVTVNVGGGSATVNVTILPASPGLFLTGNSVNVANFGQLPIPVILKPDGTFVTPSNPARKGETLIAYVTGLGPTTPSVGTNSLPIFGTPSKVGGSVIVGVNNAGVPTTFAQLSEDLIGVYLVAFQVPTDAAAGNVAFSIGLQPLGGGATQYSNPAALYIQ